MPHPTFSKTEANTRINRFNSKIQNLVLALALASLIGVYAWVMHDDAQNQIIEEHHWGKPSTEQQQNFREHAREQLALGRIATK